MSKFTSETVLNATKKGKPRKALEDALGKKVHSQLNTKLSAQWRTDPEKVTLKPHAVTTRSGELLRFLQQHTYSPIPPPDFSTLCDATTPLRYHILIHNLSQNR